jgi:hydroxymethylbilane synthase
MPLRLGTRGSALARWQAEWVAARLKELGIEVAPTPISTTGDRRHEAIGAIGGEGIFTKEIQLALLDGRIDLAVHSLKDLPTNATPGLCLAAVPERSNVADVLVSADGASLEGLRGGAAIGTGSLRRRAQLLHFRRDLQMKDIRGNVDTRLQKLRQGDYDAIVLAEAGLRRLNFAEHIAQVLPLTIMLPAVGQGALGLETRENDRETRRMVVRLDHPPSHAAVRAERAMLSALRGGCMAPIAALGRVEGGNLTLTGRVVSHDGANLLETSRTAPVADAESLGRQVADALLAQGAGEWIRVSREA